MRISLAQINCHIGNFTENLVRTRHYIQRARKEGSDLVIFPELSVCGYPPLDLLERREFIDRCMKEVEALASESKDIGIIVGSPTHNTLPRGKNLFNSAYFLHDGKIQQVFHKTLLPTYDIFDEYRYFEPNDTFGILHFKGKKIAVTICEDLWDDQPSEQVFGKNRLYPLSPMDKLAPLKPDLLVNIAASPFSYRKIDIKRQIFTTKALRHNIPVLYVNHVGAQTELIFEGASMAVSPRGGVAHQLAFFREELFTVALDDLIKGEVSEKEVEKDIIKLIHDALVMGIRDFFRKQGLTTAILGLSGGIDSAVVLVLASKALGPENIRVLIMPSRYSSATAVDDAVELADRLRVRYDVVSIEPAFKAFGESVSPLFSGTKPDVTEENIQARIRAVLLMAVSNKYGNILLNTSNKSEAAVGYGTLYGDMCGGLSVIGDIYKTDVYRLARYINGVTEIIPSNTMTKPPSAELKDNQLDTDSLPPYDVLDPILFNFIELNLPLEEIISKGFDPMLVRKVLDMVNRCEYKRYQAPPILRISSKAFGFGRRIPIVARKDWGM